MQHTVLLKYLLCGLCMHACIKGPLTMSSSNHAVPFLSSHSQSVLSHLQLRSYNKQTQIGTLQYKLWQSTCWWGGGLIDTTQFKKSRVLIGSTFMRRNMSLGHCFNTHYLAACMCTNMQASITLSHDVSHAILRGT